MQSVMSHFIIQGVRKSYDITDTVSSIVFFIINNIYLIPVHICMTYVCTISDSWTVIDNKK